MVRIAINGFGRIGRTAFKIAFDKGMEIVALNDLTKVNELAYLLKHDSNYGLYTRDVQVDGNDLLVDGKRIKGLTERDPEKLPWKEMKIDVVLECTGRYTEKSEAEKHLKAGAKKVIISAPAKGGVDTLVLGVKNTTKESVVSNASCTSNCIIPVMAVLDEQFGVQKAAMSTIHAYTQDQHLHDAPHKDLRRARAAAENIVPTSTGAASATGDVLPAMKGKFDGMAFRVPVPVVSLSDFTVLTKKKVTVEQVNEAFKKAAASARFKGILAVTEEALVSSDFKGNPYSSIVDLGLTKVIDGDLVKVVAWYDNEFGYSNRLVELAEKLAKA
ncbi:type I glyceraldehyde-3-phosphate dehydrogenase [Candidatus Micrarchaeota archaeon]|nr:type I glyceraldehyde-3-phosphate dehydrogenase [Candidatus Micrarchaeota archaeon]